jgi:hypothetical protein
MRGGVVAQADSSAGNASFVAQNGSVVLVFTRPTSGFLSSGFTKVAAAYGRGTVFRKHAMAKVCQSAVAADSVTTSCRCKVVTKLSLD